jgi:hypothetical protein
MAHPPDARPEVPGALLNAKGAFHFLSAVFLGGYNLSTRTFVSVRPPFIVNENGQT